MNRIEMEAFVNERRKQEGRNFEKDHSMDECIEKLLLKGVYGNPEYVEPKRPHRKKKK